MARDGTTDERFDTFEPVNELERALLAAQDGEMDQVSFLEQLAAAQVSILVDQEFADTEHPEGVRPLVLEGPEGESLLAVFTAPARGYPMTEQNPDFAFAVEVSFPWAVHATWSGMGVVVNPGWGVGLTLPPASVEHMKGNATPAS
ncbi:MAG: SseB family protein [Ectothiorhodospiraceae bacterium]